MSDAQATFTATLDDSGIRSAAKSSVSALEKLGMQIQKRSKDLGALKAAQSRLVQSSGVQEYLKRQKVIEKNEAHEKQASARAVKAAEKRSAAEKLATAQQINAQSSTGVDPAEMAKLEEAAKALGVSAEDAGKLAQEAMKAEEALAAVKAELEGLQAAQAALSKNDASVSQFRDQGKVIKSTEAELADLQSQYSAAGGSATDLASEIKEPTEKVKSLAEQAKAAGGPLGGLASKIEGVASAAKSAGPLALVAVLIAIAVAAVTAGVALAKFAAASANAARNSARMRLNAAMGSDVGAKDISSTMAALRANTAASKEEAQALAVELYRLGDRGAKLEETALTIERFGQAGEETKGQIKGLYEELRKPIGAVGIAGGVAKSMVVTKDMLPRDVFLDLASKLGKDGNKALLQGFTANKDQIRDALGRIGEQKFAGSALEQMRSLDKLSERLHENLESLFSGLKTGILLGALQKLVGLLDESSESGKAIRDALGAIAQPISDAIEAALPYLEVFIEGMIYMALVVVLMGLKIKNALSGLIPESLTKNIDWLEVAFWAGAIVMAVFSAAAIALALTLLALSLPFWTVIGLIVLLVVAIVMAIDYIVGLVDGIATAFDDIDFAGIGKYITDGIATGLADGAKAIFDAMTKLGEGAYAAFKAAIKSKSPSVLFRMAGRTIPQGVGLGVEDESDRVSDAVAAMTDPSDMVAPRGGKRDNGGGGPRTYHITINVASSDELLDESFGRRFMRMLDGAAIEGGLSPEPETA